MIPVTVVLVKTVVSDGGDGLAGVEGLAVMWQIWTQKGSMVPAIQP